MKILIVGGSKSGKSMAAQRIARMLAARGSCPAYYWATMEPSDSEDESALRATLKREPVGALKPSNAAEIPPLFRIGSRRLRTF